MTKAIRKTRAQWAAEIRAAHKQSIAAILKMGRTLIAAKRALEHGTFQKMIDHDLPFDASTAQRLMKIARDPRLANAARTQLLPIAWGTLYELTKLSDAEFKRAVSSRAIHPEMTREQARTVRVGVSKDTVVPYTVGVKAVEYTTKTFAAMPYYQEDENEDAIRIVSSQPVLDSERNLSVASIAIARIKRLFGELAAAVKHGDLDKDDVLNEVNAGIKMIEQET